jgi:hypothetical protein
MTLIKIDPNSIENQIAERIKSMLYKVQRTGTSQDTEEFVTYLDQHQYKGFTCLIAKIPTKKKHPVILDISTHSGSTYKYIGSAKETSDEKGILLKTDKFDTLKDTGKQLHYYIDLIRKPRGINVNNKRSL